MHTYVFMCYTLFSFTSISYRYNTLCDVLQTINKESKKFYIPQFSANFLYKYIKLKYIHMCVYESFLNKNIVLKVLLSAFFLFVDSVLWKLLRLVWIQSQKCQFHFWSESERLNVTSCANTFVCVSLCVGQVVWVT